MNNPLHQSVTSGIAFITGSVPTAVTTIETGHLSIFTQGNILFAFQIVAFAVTIVAGICAVINYRKEWKKKRKK